MSFAAFITSSKDSRNQWALKSLPLAATVVTGSTEVVMNGIFKSMGMAPIPCSHFYRFQKRYRVDYIQAEAELESTELREEAGNNGDPLCVQFDTRHASARCSKHSTSSWIDSSSG